MGNMQLVTTKGALTGLLFSRFGLGQAGSDALPGSHDTTIVFG